jgi:hypothetical protein
MSRSWYRHLRVWLRDYRQHHRCQPVLQRVGGRRDHIQDYAWLRGLLVVHWWPAHPRPGYRGYWAAVLLAVPYYSRWLARRRFNRFGLQP